MNFLKKIFGGLKTDYVSPIDQFLYELAAKYPKKSRSQLRIINKYKRIVFLRDHVVKQDANRIWEGF